MEHTHDESPHEHLDERAEMLLGKSLLGQASEAELAELSALRASSARLREVMGILDGSAEDVRAASPGEPVSLGAEDLPDYLRPTGLARGVRRWFWIWLVSGTLAAAAVATVVVGASTMMQSGSTGGARLGVLGPALFGIVAVFGIAGYLRRDAVLERLAGGGADWQRAVEAVREQERRFFSPRANATVAICAAATVVLMAIAIGVRGQPGGVLLLLSALPLTMVLRIAKRRLLLMGLRDRRPRWSR